MDTQYGCFIFALLIATLSLLVRVFKGYRHKRNIKAPVFVLKALLVSLAVTIIIMLTSDVEDIASLYIGIMMCSLYFFIFGLFVILMSYKHGPSEKAGSILVVLLMVFLGAAITSWNNIDIEEVFYKVSVVVENETGPQEDVVLYIPLPNGYPEDFFAFGKGNHSVISTEHGRMLSLSTSSNVTLATTLKDDWNFWDYLKSTPDDEPDLTTRSGNLVYFFLENTSCKVSVNLFFMAEVTERYYYMAVGDIIEGSDSSNSPSPWPWYPGYEKVLLSPGWNEIELLRGETSWDYY